MDFYLFPNDSTITDLNLKPNETLGFAQLNYSSLDGAYNGYSLVAAGSFSNIQFEKSIYTPQFSSAVIEEFSPVTSSAPVSQQWATSKLVFFFFCLYINTKLILFYNTSQLAGGIQRKIWFPFNGCTLITK